MNLFFAKRFSPLEQVPLLFSLTFGRSLKEFRVFALLTAILLYGSFGSPTPDIPGMVELLIAVLLVLAAGPAGIMDAFCLSKKEPFWSGAGKLLLIYGFGFTLVTAALFAAPPSLILRDFIPFLFMLFPLFFSPLLKENPNSTHPLLITVIISALIFSLRSLVNYFPFLIPPDELYYLANVPGVLLSAALLIALPSYRFIKSPNLKNLIILAIALGLALLPIAAMAATLQRASLGFLALYLIGLSALGFCRYPIRLGGIAILIILAALPFIPILSSLFEALSHKTSLYGLNMRFQEFSAVWNEVSKTPATLLFGQGWGASFESPAVAGIRVHYTHSLLSAMILKTGLIGLSLSLAYLYGIGRILLSHIRTSPLLAMALSGPFIINIFLYASYKSLDFGLLLLLITSLNITLGVKNYTPKIASQG